MGDRILVGVDGSDGSRQALRWALHEAQVRRGVLAPVVAWESPFDVGFGQTEMVYVPVDEAKIAAGAQQRLDDLLHQVAGPQVPVEVDAAVVHGEAAQVLCDGSADAALLVVGSRGHGSFTRLLLGSVSAKCAHHSQCPVVIVPKAKQGDEQRFADTGRIVVGIDGSDGSRRALQWAVEEAWRRGGSVVALGIWNDPYGHDASPGLPVSSLRPDPALLLHAARERIEAVVGEVVGTGPGPEVQAVAVEGDPAQTLVERSADADLLVVGARGLGGFNALLLGSVSAKCAQHSRCPVVVVPAAAWRGFR